MSYENQAIRNVTNHYGPMHLHPEKGGEIDEKVFKTVQWTFSYNALPSPSANKLEYSIPANATIVSAKLQIIEAFTSTSTTTDLLIGLSKADGSAIDVDGLFAGTESTQTAIAVVGSLITGAGNLIGKTIGTDAGELIVAGSVNDLLSGRARLIVEYLDVGMKAK